MKVGISIRVMGPQSSRETITELLESAERIGIESAWIVDHIAIPPDDAEGSDGRYLDPLSTLAFMAGKTSSIKIGTSVLILPYRQKLPTAKAIATIQELSDGRLMLGVGIGWMPSEFKALGVDRTDRGKISDDTLAFLNECFGQDVVSLNDQQFLFRPRPAKPPIFIGGAAPHAVDRALEYGDGWLPIGRLDKLEPQIRDYLERAKSLSRAAEVTTFFSLEAELAASQAKIEQYRSAGVSRLIIGTTYSDASDWQPVFEQINQLSF